MSDGHRRAQRRRHRRHALGDHTLCVTEWAEVAGLSRQTLAYRLKTGMPLGRAISQPADRTSAARVAVLTRWQKDHENRSKK